MYKIKEIRHTDTYELSKLVENQVQLDVAQEYLKENDVIVKISTLEAPDGGSNLIIEGQEYGNHYVGLRGMLMKHIQTFPRKKLMMQDPEFKHAVKVLKRLEREGVIKINGNGEGYFKLEDYE